MLAALFRSGFPAASSLAAVVGLALAGVPINSAAQPPNSPKSPVCVPCLSGVGLNEYEAADRPAVAASRRRELETLRLGTARRRPNETVAVFLQRVLPASYSNAYGDGAKVVQYPWHPGPFGPQLFFSVACNGGDKWDIENNGGSDLFILDPLQPDTYAVQLLRLGTMGDLTTVAALFFADVNQDGQKELLVLKKVSLKESDIGEDGEREFFHADHYTTTIFRYRAQTAASRPRYEPDPTPRPYLEDLATAAEVRRALAYHPPKRKSGPR